MHIVGCCLSKGRDSCCQIAMSQLYNEPACFSRQASDTAANRQAAYQSHTCTRCRYTPRRQLEVAEYDQEALADRRRLQTAITRIRLVASNTSPILTLAASHRPPVVSATADLCTVTVSVYTSGRQRKYCRCPEARRVA